MVNTDEDPLLVVPAELKSLDGDHFAHIPDKHR